ncbi:ATP-binding protein [Sphingopyxis indica]|uniref:ATP-binding protein n=1 Tax=Sphingopyxis indica TaxID=436663 RepID=UPI001482F238|nr:ATP-binding protein [Sphingopyxis indica]
MSRATPARAASTSISSCRRRLILTINDDGIGICPVLAAGKTVRNRGVGLASMRERVAQLGGTFAIARTSRGTMVSAELPRAA